MDVRIVDFPETRVAVFEHRGPPHLEHETTAKLVAWRIANRRPPHLHRTYGLHYDDPRTTPPADYRMDLNVAYKPSWLKGFTAKVDVFNLFNRQSIESIEERYYTAGASTPRANAGTGAWSVQSYTAPRTVKLTASYDYKFN